MKIGYNPLYKKDGKTAVGALSSAPASDVIFDLPGLAVWARGIKFKGRDHVYTFDHDDYITLKTTSKADDVTDIKIGLDIANIIKLAMVYQDITTDKAFPLVWTNLTDNAATASSTLYKSQSDITYNPKTKTLSTTAFSAAGGFYKTGSDNNYVLLGGGGHKALSEFSLSNHTHSILNTAFYFNNSDIPEGATNLSTAAKAHTIQFYRNGFLIPYQMDNANDGGMFRVRGNSESSCIAEIATWDDSGAGETIQFNYYPTTSQVTPTYSVTVPKKSGTIALLSDLPTKSSWNYDDVYSKLNHLHDRLYEEQLNKTKFKTWFDTSANVHKTGYLGDVFVKRFFTLDADTPATYELPVVDNHIIGFSIDSNTNWLRAISLDIRSSDIYTIAKTNNTWGNWFKILTSGNSYWGTVSGTNVPLTINGTTYTLTNSSHTHAYLPLAGGTMTGNITFSAPTAAGQKRGFTFNGVTDSASVYYIEPNLSDDGRIRFEISDNPDDRIEFAWNLWNASDLGVTNPNIKHVFTYNSYTAYCPITSTGTITGASFSKTGGTANLFLMANGTILDKITVINNTSTDLQIPTALAVYNAINAGFAANDAMIYKGTYDANGVATAITVNTAKFSNAPGTTSLGWTWKVINSGFFGNIPVEPGDMIIASVENPGTTTTNYNVIQYNIDMNNLWWADLKWSATSKNDTTPRFGKIAIGTAIDNNYPLRVNGKAWISGDTYVNHSLPNATNTYDLGNTTYRWRYLYLTNQLVSTLATGTAPFNIASTTLNTNLNADLLDGLHASSFVKMKLFRFSQYNNGTWTKILTITINSTTDLLPVIAFSWIPSECARTVWADFSINWKSNSPIFYAVWKGMDARTLKVVNSSGAIWDVWVSGTKANYDPFGEIQVTYTHNIISYNGGNLGYSDTDPGGTVCTTGGIVNYANSAGSATNTTNAQNVRIDLYTSTGDYPVIWADSASSNANNNTISRLYKTWKYLYWTPNKKTLTLAGNGTKCAIGSDYDTADRPGLHITGNYPEIVMMSLNISNNAHGATLTLGAYTSSSDSETGYYAFCIGASGTTTAVNARYLDFGYGINPNPHSLGINNYGNGSSNNPYIMRLTDTKRIFMQGSGDNVAPVLTVSATRASTWVYNASFLDANLAAGHNNWINIGKANSTRNSFGFSHFHNGDGATSNYGAVEIFGVGNIQRWHYDKHTQFLGRVDVANNANDANYMQSALQIREYNYGGAQSDTWAIAPRLSWHWSGRVLAQIGLASNNHLYISEDSFAHAYMIAHQGNTYISGGKGYIFNTEITLVDNATNSLFAKYVKHANIGSTGYVSGDTHYMYLGYMDCSGSYDRLTLLITSAFWGNQHGSQDIITILQANNTNSNPVVLCTVGRVWLGGSNERTFYYKKEGSNKLHLYVYVTGGNSYGGWTISGLNADSDRWHTDGTKNVTKESSWVEIGYSGKINTSLLANIWTTARTLTIGNTGKSVNGSTDVSWTLAEIGAAAASHNHDNVYVKKAGDTMTGELKNTSLNAYRLSYGNYGVIHRNDGANYHILLTDYGKASDGGWNSLRPFSIHLNNGRVSMNNKATISANLGVNGSNDNYNLYVNGSAMIQNSVANLCILSTATNDDLYAILRLWNKSGNGGVIFLNGSARTSDGGQNWMTIRNDVGNVRIDDLTWVTGELRVGNAAAGPNRITFYGVNGDAPGSFNHTWIAERLFSANETDTGASDLAELVLFKGNDPGNANSATASSPGPDRIRHIAAAHRFQSYNSALSGDPETVCRSTALKTLMDIAYNRVTLSVPLYVLGEQYNGNAGIWMNNSDIRGLNAIYTSDVADDSGEGYQFYRSDGKYDSVWSKNGIFYYSPGRTADYIVLHTGNSYVSSGIGYINNVAITQVSNADTVDGLHSSAFYRLISYNNADGSKDCNDFISDAFYTFKYDFNSSSNTLSNKPSSAGIEGGCAVLNINHGYSNQIFFDYGGGGLWFRGQSWTGSERKWSAWKILIHSGNYTSYVNSTNFPILGYSPDDFQLAGLYVTYNKNTARSTIDGTNSYPAFYNLENNELISGYLKYYYVINIGKYTGNNYAAQIAVPYQHEVTDSDLFVRVAKGSSWRTWRKMLHTGNSSISGNTITINGISTTWSNTAHTTFAWTGGTTAGPTGSLSGNHTAVSFPAIPSASDSASGIVTIGALTFAGNKTFANNVNIKGDLTIEGTSVANNTYIGYSTNAVIKFTHADGQNGALIWTTHDTVLKPAALTLCGNLGNEYFIAPNIRATRGFYKNGSSNDYVLLGGSGHKALSDFSMAHSHPYLPFNAIVANADANSLTNGIWHTGTDSNTTTISNTPNNTSMAIISITPYSASGDVRTAQFAFDAYGKAYVRGSRTSNFPWYTILTSGNWSDIVTWSTLPGKPSTFTPSDHNHDNKYVKLSSTEQTIESTIGSFSKGIIEFYRSSGDHIAFISFANKDANGNKRSLGAIGFYSGGVGKLLYRDTNANYYNILHTGNSSVSGGGSSWGSSITVNIGGTSKTLTIPSNPNTHYTTRIYAGASGTNTNAAVTNPYLKVTDDNVYRNQVRFIGSGTVSIASDANGNITITGGTGSHSHTWASITDKIAGGNEFNIVTAGYNNSLWFNYLPIDNRSSTATITGYLMGNGQSGYATVTSAGFIKNGSSNSYVLLGGGGHKLESSLNVNSATNSTYARYSYIENTDYSGNMYLYFGFAGNGYNSSIYQSSYLKFHPYNGKLTVSNWEGEGYIYYGENGAYIHGDADGWLTIKAIYQMTFMINNSTVFCMDEDSRASFGSSSRTMNVYATHFYEHSDIRYKNILNYINLNSKELAQIPIFNFEWSPTGCIGSGTSAQAVLEILPYLVTQVDDILTLDYGALGTIAGITACREINQININLATQKSELERLKDEVRELKEKLNKYELGL